MEGYTLTRSKRKTAVIYVRDGSVEVRAPLKMPKHEIDRFVSAKEQWITDRLAKSQAQSERRESFTVTYGNMVLYHGKQYPIVAKASQGTGFDGISFYMPPDLLPNEIKASCIQIYRLLAKNDLTTFTSIFAKKMGVIPFDVKINGSKTRWGSCSARKSINYSWRLIMASESVIEYIVVHELAHLIEMNHSLRFWSIVEGVLPDYRNREAELRKLQMRLMGENWDI